MDATTNDGTYLEGVVFVNNSDYRCVCTRGYAGRNCDGRFVAQATNRYKLEENIVVKVRKLLPKDPKSSKFLI